MLLKQTEVFVYFFYLLAVRIMSPSQVSDINILSTVYIMWPWKLVCTGKENSVLCCLTVVSLIFVGINFGGLSEYHSFKETWILSIQNVNN